METIVDKFVREIETQLAERKIAISLTPAARAHFASAGYDPAFGARPLARVLQAELRDPLTEEILFGALDKGGSVTVDVADGKVALSPKPADSPAPG
jgi:ATP-dependent Clp protease ATP-binding subunit ClpA